MDFNVEVITSDGKRELFIYPFALYFRRVDDFIYIEARNESNTLTLAMFYRPIGVKFVDKNAKIS